MNRIATRLGIMTLLLMSSGIKAVADDSSSPVATEKDLLGVWVLHGDADQIIHIQIFCQNHWFASLEMGTADLSEWDRDAGAQTGKWSIVGDRLKLDYEVGDHHTNPKFKVNSSIPPQLVILPDTDAPDGGFIWSKLEAPAEISESAIAGSWIYGWNQTAAPYAWNLAEKNRFSVRLADDSGVYEQGNWHVFGNKISVAVTESSTPEDVGFSGGGDIVMLTPNWLLVDEKLTESRYKLDLFHRPVLLKTGLPGNKSNIPNAGEIRPPLDGPAAVARAKSDLSALSAALDLFDVDNGRYPSQAEGLTALTLRPANLPAWHSYEIKLPSDPWGHPYVYHAPGKNGQPYDIFSCGPDGKEDTADDIRE